TGAVRRIKELVDSGALGRLYYYDSVRVNLGLFQHDVNVLWDLAVHDLAIMDYILGAQPHSVAATGAAPVPGHPVNMAYLTGLTAGLRVEAQHFLECIRHDRQPLTNGQSALRVIRVLEAAVQSLEQGGRPIELPPVEPLPLPAVATEQAV